MKRSDIIFVTSLIEKANPLKLRNEDGTSLCFFSLREAYIHVLEAIESHSATIYADVEYIISKLYNMRRISDVHRIYIQYFSPLGIKEQQTLHPDFSENKMFYRTFIKALHSYSMTKFDEGMFTQAYTMFVASRTAKPTIKSNEEIENEKRTKAENTSETEAHF